MAAETSAGSGLVAEGATAGFDALAAAGTGAKAFVLANPLTMAALGGVLVGVGGYYAYNRWRNKSGKEAQAGAEQKPADEAAEPSAA